MFERDEMHKTKDKRQKTKDKKTKKKGGEVGVGVGGEEEEVISQN